MPLLVAFFLAFTTTASAQKDTLFFPPHCYIIIDNEEWVSRETSSFVKLRKKDYMIFEAQARYKEHDSIITPDNFIDKTLQKEYKYDKLTVANRSKLDDTTYLLELVPNIDECSEIELPKEFLSIKLYYIVKYINSNTSFTLELDDDIYILLQSFPLKDNLLELYSNVRFTNPKELDQLMGYPLSSERVNFEVNKKYQSIYKRNYQELLKKRKCYDDEALLERLKMIHPADLIDSLARYQNDSTLAHLYAEINANSEAESIREDLQKLAEVKFTNEEYYSLFEKSKRAEYKLEDYLDLVLGNFRENGITRLLNLSTAADKRIDNSDYKIIAGNLIKIEEKLDSSFELFGLDKIDETLAVVNFISILKAQAINYFIIKENEKYILKPFDIPDEKLPHQNYPTVSDLEYLLDHEISSLDLGRHNSIIFSKNKNLLLFTKVANKQQYYQSSKNIGSDWRQAPVMSIDSSSYLVISNFLGNKERFGIIRWDKFKDEKEKYRLEKIVSELTGNSLDYYCEKDSLGNIVSINDDGAQIIKANMKPEHFLLTTTSFTDVDGDKQDELVHLAISNGKIISQKIYKLNKDTLEPMPAKSSLKILMKNTVVLNSLLISQIKNHSEEKLEDTEQLFGFNKE